MAVTIDNIPVYEAILGEDCGMLRVSLVDEPAVMKDFVAMKEEAQRCLFAIEDEEKRLVRGVVMRADFPIYRRSEKLGEYYIIYRADTIREMAQRYLAENRANLVDLMHDGKDVEGVEMVQFFIKDSAAGVTPEGFADVADGSLFAEYHVTNDDVWASVKDGTFQGFSLEGIFDLEPVPASEADDIDQIVRGLNGLFTIIKSKTMNKIEKLKAALAAALVSLRNVTTDKGVLYWDGDEDLKEGDAVYTGEDDDRIPAQDGDYTTADGKTITVADGVVSKIVDADAEVAGNDPEDDPEELSRSERFARIREDFGTSFDEMWRLIASAIWDVLPDDRKDGWLCDAGDDYGVWEYYDEDYASHWVRYAITFDERETSATASDPVDVKPAFIPVDQEVSFEEQLSAMTAERDSLLQEVERLKALPAAPAAHEAFGGGSIEKTGNKGLDNIARLMNAK